MDVASSKIVSPINYVAW